MKPFGNNIRRNIVRGTRSTTLRDEARICGELRGYRWLSHTDPASLFDGLMCRTAAVVVVKLKKVRYAKNGEEVQ